MDSVVELPFTVTIQVAFRDLDALGHVNNAVYFSYMETARIAYFLEVSQLRDIREIGMILAEATCTYHSPAYFGERLQVGVGVSRFGSKSFDLRYHIQAEDGRLVASGKTVQVAYDYAAGKTVSVPAELKQKFLDFQQGTLV